MVYVVAIECPIGEPLRIHSQCLQHIISLYRHIYTNKTISPAEDMLRRVGGWQQLLCRGLQQNLQPPPVSSTRALSTCATQSLYPRSLDHRIDRSRLPAFITCSRRPCPTHQTSSFLQAHTASRFCSTHRLVSMSGGAVSGTPTDSTQFRLPTDLKPTHYDLTVRTDLESSKFDGFVEVT